MDIISVNRQAILNFMNDGSGSGHHTAIAAILGEPLAVGLLLHYLNAQGFKAECISTKVTQGTKAGERLDAWITAEKEGRRVLYQTEIKMWAGNAIGGLRLAHNADEATLMKGAARQWARVWDASQQTFKADSVRKVLKKMNPPAGYEDWPIEPLACFWWLMRSQPEDGCWFTLAVGEATDTPFKQVHVFSLTAYLLSLDQDVLPLPLPLVRERLQVLGNLFGTPGQHWTDTFRMGL